MKLSFKYKLAISFINIISKTWRIKIEGDKPHKGIVLFWHGKMLPGWKVLSDKNPKAVVSQSKDGEILSAILQKWGFELIRGSSSKGGKEVLNNIVESARDSLILMTPDGPRGPAEQMKAGAVIASQRAEVPLTLCGILIERKKIFEKSWDKFEFPMPFSKIIVKYSKPYYIESSGDRKYTEQKINDIGLELEKINENIRD
jgi:lysophospholipid acyltransferase (LPLAT)-like uncharacterized protein